MRTIMAVAIAVAVTAASWAGAVVLGLDADQLGSRICMGLAVALTGAGAAVTGVWFLRFIPPRLKPGEQIVSDSEFRQFEDVYGRAVAATSGKQQGAPRDLGSLRRVV